MIYHLTLSYAAATIILFNPITRFTEILANYKPLG